jgi:hypothetical protein
MAVARVLSASGKFGSIASCWPLGNCASRKHFEASTLCQPARRQSQLSRVGIPVILGAGESAPAREPRAFSGVSFFQDSQVHSLLLTFDGSTLASTML